MSSRPIYENEATLSSENANRVAIEHVLGGKLIKLPVQYGLDWAMVNHLNTIEKWVELKARTGPSTLYSTYAISSMKVQRALQLERETGLPALLVVRFSDGVYTTYFKRFTERSVVIRMGGRTDRNDPEDQEPMWHIPTGKLTRVLDAVPGGEAVKVEGKPNGGSDTSGPKIP